MPFTFKLSRRLARLWVTLTAAALACERRGAAPTGPAPQIVQIVVVPESLTLEPAQQSKFVAYGRSSIGDSTSAAVVWSASAGAIASDGMYTADTLPGDFLVTATSTQANLSGSSRVHVRKVASVVVTPAAASVPVGQMVQLTATLKDAAGNVLTGRTVSWASSTPGVATVSSSGLVTGLGAGTTTVTATSEGQSGTAAVTVTPPAAGSNSIFVEGFESGTLSAWDDNYLAANHTVVTDPAGAHSGSHYLQILYPQGANGGSLSKFFLPGYDSVYARYYIRFPTTWQGGTKLLLLRGSRTDNVWSSFGVAGQCPIGTNFFAANVVYDATRYLLFYTYYYGMPKQPDNVTCWGVDGSAASPPSVSNPPLTISLGVWHLVEFQVILNTPGQANGVQRFWLDGVLKGEWQGLVFRTTRDLMLNVLTLESSAPPAPQTQVLYVDDILVTTARP